MLRQWSDYLAAIDSYATAIRLDPEYSEAFYNRGLVNLMSHRYELGCEDLIEAERLGYTKASLKRKAFCGY